jgi:cytochrome c-type biogenesis protein
VCPFTDDPRTCEHWLVAAAVGGVDAPLALALTAGVVTAFNPCGFAMLPAYVSYFVGSSGADRSPLPQRLLRAALVGVIVTLGFLTVFGLIGLAASGFRSSVTRIAPYISMVVGLVLAAFGVAMLRGFEPTFRLPVLPAARSGKELRSMYVYGVSFAIVSLGCALPGFMSAVVTSFRSDSLASGMQVYLAFSLGMGLVLVVISFAVALAQHAVVRGMRKLLPYVNRASGALLVAAGLYVSYYGYYEWRTLVRFETAPAGPVTWVTSWSASIKTWVDGLSTSVLVGAVIVIAGIAAASFALARGTRPDDRAAK